LSLLLDALKRAEQEKLARNPADSPPAQNVRASSAPAANSLELQPIGAGPAANSPGLGPARSEPGAAHAAQNVFQAKTDAQQPRSKGMVWATIGAIAVVAIAAGAYVWYSVKSLTPQQATFSTPRPRPINSSGLPPPTAPPDAALATPAAPLRDPLPPGAPVASLQAMPPAAPVPAPASSESAPAPRVRDDPVSRVLRESARPTVQPAPRLERSAATPRQVPADVIAGYEALKRGNLLGARANYNAAITNDPTSIDAHLGLATVEARSGNRSAAVSQYRRVLDLDSRNSIALAGIAALTEYSRPEALEGQLHADLTRFPESSALHFTLGNLLSAQSRWSEAQLEYYEAHRLDPGNGDVMYNLAVSLDHLGQTRPAAGFYARALEAARGQPAQFDQAAAQRRLGQIR
jgi:tetratricopeptide (TPR) repeat protein